MRTILVLTLAVATCSGALASAAPVPSYDVAKSCRTQADYAYAATLGDVDISREVEACTTREHDQKGSVEALWPLASEVDRKACLDVADGRYGYLARCLAGSRSVRATR